MTAPKAPAYVKTFICLANSRKISGRCVAGKEIGVTGVGPWIRPVSDRPTAELSEEERRFQDGKDLRLMDVVHVPMMAALPHGFQNENHLIDAGYYWVLERQATGAEVRSAIDHPGHLWTQESSTNGVNDRVGAANFGGITFSLRLIEVFDLRISVAIEGAAFGNAKRKVRGNFNYFNRHYEMAVTDPLVERQYLLLPDGVHDVGHAILCVSLGEPFHGYAYKLIAGVIPNPAF